MTKLPTLIFTEDHDDPITGLILEKLTPVLKTMGYAYFFEELPDSDKLEDIYKNFSEKEDYWLKIRPALKKIQAIDITDPACLNHPFFKTDPGKVLYTVIDRYLPQKNNIRFYHALEHHGIQYQGIDLDCTNASSDAMMRLRNIVMADAYLKINEPVFGRIGLDHAIGMQKIFLEKSLNAAESYLFFNIYSNPPLDVCDHLEQKVRNRQLQSPLEIIPIDASKNGIDEIIYMIVQHIKEKQTAARHLVNQPRLC